MSDYSILSKEAQADTLYDLTKEQQTMIETCIESLKEISKDGKVSEGNLRRITSLWRELDSLRELMFLRLLNCLKRGDKILN